MERGLVLAVIVILAVGFIGSTQQSGTSTFSGEFFFNILDDGTGGSSGSSCKCPIDNADSGCVSKDEGVGNICGAQTCSKKISSWSWDDGGLVWSSRTIKKTCSEPSDLDDDGDPILNKCGACSFTSAPPLVPGSGSWSGAPCSVSEAVACNSVLCVMTYTGTTGSFSLPGKCTLA